MVGYFMTFRFFCTSMPKRITANRGVTPCDESFDRLQLENVLFSSITGGEPHTETVGEIYSQLYWDSNYNHLSHLTRQWPFASGGISQWWQVINSQSTSTFKVKCHSVDFRHPRFVFEIRICELEVWICKTTIAYCQSLDEKLPSYGV